VTLLATARSPESVGGLAVLQDRGRLVLEIGEQTLASVRVPAVVTGRDCSYRLRLDGGQWTLEGGPEGTTRSGLVEGVPQQFGRIQGMPVVFGLFSALDLRADDSLSVDVTTTVHATTTTLRQTAAWILAVLALVAALLLVALDQRPGPPNARRLLESLVAHAHPADAVVGVALLSWWVLSPAFVDDGFVTARQRMFSSARGFSEYLSAFATNLPNGYWLEWVQHWLVQSTTSLLLHRLPALACLAAVWVVARWIFARVVGPGAAAVGLWTLATTFLVGVVAWGMTLRPEPVAALLVTAVLACSVRFLEKETAGPLALSAVLVPLALTAHHAGIVALAPLLVTAPAVLRWTRPRIAVASTIVSSSIALLAVLLFVGSDLEQRRADAEMTALFGGSQETWRDEIRRYLFLQTSTPVRRAAVALMLLAVLAFVVRRRRERLPLLDLPATALGVALILFIATPSKWPWHFGASIGMAAVAVACEAERIRRDGARSRGWSAWPLVAVGAVVVAIAWCWSPRFPGSAADLRTLDWTLGLERWIELSTIALAIPFLLFAGLAVVARARGRDRDLPGATWTVAAWLAALFAVPLLLFTAGTLAADAAKTSSWTLSRQNLGTLAGRGGCGLADDMLVPVESSVRPLTSATGGTGEPPEWVPAAPVAGVPRFSLAPAASSRARTPWFALPADDRIGLFVHGTPGPARLELEWGRRRAGAIETLGSGVIPTVFAEDASSWLEWRLVLGGELPAPPPGADVVRIAVPRRSPVAPPLAVTAPVTYESEPLAGSLSRPGERTLVLSELLTYFPCARLPVLGGGTVEVPSQIVLLSRSRSPVGNPFLSPWAGLFDLYRLERRSVADSANPLPELLVVGVDPRIPGAVRAPATRTTPP
jgi:Mycobacterial cell wall arabinan synthesis protein